MTIVVHPASIARPGGMGFRVDINALRALSVVAVLGYHLQLPGFAGGFVGVDVFFVITGYLMTGKVLNDLMSGRFSFQDFLVKRLRRIYPALVVVAIATAVAGWFLTMPGEYLRHLRQACYALLFLSNFAFDADNGYFAMAAQTKPLLHTWSLAVEWQFYLWMPLIVWSVWRVAARSQSKLNASLIALLTVAGMSLIWCFWQSQNDAVGSAFFSLRARAWEPLVGGLIAVVEIRQRAAGVSKGSWVVSPIVAAAGWLLTAACIVFPLPAKQWPGLLTVLPIVGAAAVIAARQNGRLLGISLIQRVGDWSYSIYLWHWPIWVMALGWLSFRGYAVGPMEKGLMVVASLALGAASYHLVEQPIRTRREFWTFRRLLVGSGAVFAALLAVTVMAFVTTGFPSRLPGYLLAAEMARKTATPRDECFRNANSVKQASETYCSFGSDELAGKPSAILWGDSFANQYLDPISAAAGTNGIHGLIATQSACRAFADDPAKNAADQRACREFNRTTLAFVMDRAEPSIVVLGSNWIHAGEIAALVERLLSSGKTVILIMPLLNVGFDVPQRWIEKQARVGEAIDEWKVKADATLTLQPLRDDIRQLLMKQKGNPKLVTVNPSTVICELEYCYLVRNGQANFRDTVHISNVNAEQYAALFDAAFRTALRPVTTENTD